MTDHLGIFDRNERDDQGGQTGQTGEVDLTELREALARVPAEEPVIPPTRSSARRESRERYQAERDRRRRRRRSSLIAVLVLAVIAAGVVVGFQIWRSNQDQIPDFAGTGDSEVIVRVQSGDSLDDIAKTLADNQVVASAAGFVAQTTSDADVRSLSPGYYRVRQHASAAAAADALVDPANRVGRIRLIPGRQLADVSARSGDRSTIVPGYISEIAQKACVPLNGQSSCFTADQLWQVAETALPSDLGVVEWAVDGVSKAPDRRKRLEGVILPGDYDVPPNSGPLEALRSVVSASASLWNQSEIVSDSKTLGLTPYQVMIIASIVEREGLTPDMPKVARVIYNRLKINRMLQMDSTVNYALDRAQIATTKQDRDNPSPYNTYEHKGLPPTPISSPGQAAVDAAVDPAEGGWLFFVKVDLQGNSCFSVTEAEHTACVDEARKNGVFG